MFALILFLIIFKHPKYTIRKNCVDMSAMHGRGAIDICLSEKGALAKMIGKHSITLCFIPRNRRITLVPTYHTTHNNECCAAQ